MFDGKFEPNERQITIGAKDSSREIRVQSSGVEMSNHREGGGNLK